MDKELGSSRDLSQAVGGVRESGAGKTTGPAQKPVEVWRDIKTAPTDRTRFLAYQAGEVFHAYGAVHPKSGIPYFVRRTHERDQSCAYRVMKVEIDGEWSERKVLTQEPSEEYQFHWCCWSRGFDFEPTLWAPLPLRAATASPAEQNGQDPGMKTESQTQ